MHGPNPNVKSTKRMWATTAMTVAVLVGGLTGLAQPAAAAGSISAYLSKTTVVVGTTVDVIGSTSDRKATRVVLQRKGSSGWADIQSAEVKPGDWSFKTTIRPTGVGTYTFRVRSASGAAVSNTLFLNVTIPLADGTYDMVVTAARDAECYGGRMNGETLTIRGSLARLTRPKDYGDDFTGSVTRSATGFSIRVSEPDEHPAPPRSATFSGRTIANGRLTGKAKLGGPIGDGHTGFVCDYAFDAWGPHLSSAVCSVAAIRKVKPPAGEAWDASQTPTCVGVWAMAYLHNTDPLYADGPPDILILRWNGSRWALVSNACALRTTIPASIWRTGCTQD